MLVNVALMPSQACRWIDAICIFVDVRRASLTIIALFERGAGIVFPGGSVRQAQRLADEYGYLLVGERHGLKVPGFDFGNSPARDSCRLG